MKKQILWVFSGIMLGFADISANARDINFLSAWEMVRFLAEGYGLSIVLALLLGNILYSSLSLIGPIGSSKRRLTVVSCSVFYAIVISAVLINVTGVEFALGGVKNTAAVLALMAVGAAVGTLFSGLLVFLLDRSAGLSLGIMVALLLSPALLTWGYGGFAGERRPLGHPEKECPSLVIIMIDTLREDYLHCYGNNGAETPSFDRMAREGTRFLNVVAQSSWTKSSVASIMTSMHPGKAGVGDEDDALSEDIPVLPSLLRDRGLLSAAFVGNPWLSAVSGFDRGYALYAEEFGKRDRLFLFDLLYRTGLIPRPFYTDGNEILGQAEAWIRKNRDRPFYVYIHLMDVHDPYLPPPLFDSQNGGDGGNSYRRDTLIEMNERFRKLKYDPDSSTVSLMEDLYQGSVSYEDSLLGGFLDFLEEIEILDRTGVIVTGDHGEEFMEHGGTNHARTLYEEVLRVPLIVRYPPVFPPGLVVEETVQLIDLAPTVLDLYDIEAPPTFEGVSLLGLIGGKRDPSKSISARPVLSELYFRGRYQQSVRKGQWKLVAKVRERGDRSNFETELYNLKKDPREMTDLSDERQDIVDRLIRHLPKRSDEKVKKATIPKRLRKKLERLGYITP